MGEVTEGATVITLGKGDSAIVLREGGEQEVFLPPGRDDSLATETMVEVTKLAIALHDEEVKTLLSKKLRDG